MNLSEILKNYREENKISQREFARRCGLSNSLISLLEMGVNPQTGKRMEPDARTYRRLADGMGLTVKELTGLMQTQNSRVIAELYTTDDMPRGIRQISGNGTASGMIQVAADPDTLTMLQLWEEATPKSRKAIIQILKLMNEEE